tara:strand:+ start:1636 stop:2472 length:837 start_codon:yes stop_codon:yes gene_type:complete
MISRRLTKTQRNEILEAYRAGENTNIIAERFNCTSNTINRTVKTLVSATEYELIKENRSKNNQKNNEFINRKALNNNINDFEFSNIKKQNISPLDENDNKNDLTITKGKDCIKNGAQELYPLAIEDVEDFAEHKTIETHDYEHNNLDKINLDFDNNFEEIAPLVSTFGFELEKQKLELLMLNDESLPESVYMLVDKKVELDSQIISDLPEWSFLPENELKRKAILLFLNQRSAKRSCSKNQRVIKIPNINVFNVSKNYLISKGITRLILEDSIIALDK